MSLEAPVSNKRPTTNPIPVCLPDGHTIYSTHTADIRLPHVPPAACVAHLFPELHRTNLISVNQLVQAGCSATFTKSTITVTLNDLLVLQGTRNAFTGLWIVDLDNPTGEPAPHTALAVTHEDRVAFHHACLFSPAISTLEAALNKGYLPDFPGLTPKSLKQHPPHSVATAKGHLDQTRKNQRSTKPLSPIPPGYEADLLEDFFPQDKPDRRSHYCYASLISHSGQAHGDQTGKFPHTSSSGSLYIFVLYDNDSNHIFAEPLKNRQASSIVAAYQTVYRRLARAGLKPNLQRLDNECSEALKAFFHDEGVTFQLAPPGIHRRNSAERAIRTFKNHFIAGLCSTDPNFPLHLWDQLVAYAELTLNLLRGSRINPKLSAWAQVHGLFNYNDHPLVPPGTQAVVHEQPANRRTFGAHGIDGWYIGPALEAYRCHRVWCVPTRSPRTSETVEFFPKHVPLPLTTPTDQLIASLDAMIAALKDTSPGSLLPALNPSTLATINQFHSCITNLLQPTPPPAAPVSPEPVDPPTVPTIPTAPASPLRVPAVLDTTAPAPPLRVTFADIVRRSNRPISAPTVPVVPPVPAPVPVTPPRRSPRLTKLKRRPRRQMPPQANLVASIPAIQPSQPDGPPSSANAATIAPSMSEEAIHWINCVQDAVDKAIPQLSAAHSANAAVHPDTGLSVEYPALLKSSEGKLWEESNEDEFGRLAQGSSRIKQGTNTIHFIKRSAIPKGRKATYLRLVVADRPQKSNPRRVRHTCGGDKVDYPGEVATKTAGLTTAKILFNSTISTPDAKFMCIDLKDFYLNTDMERYEYMRIPVSVIPPAIMELYNLHLLVENGYVYVEIRKGMYGLPQAGRIANDKLIPILAKAGYHQSSLIPGLFKHATRPISFCLVVDDFGVKYVGREHAEHLLATLQVDYVASTDWDGNLFCGITLDWDYTNGTCDLSMPGYIAAALQKFAHPTPSRPQDSPHAWAKPVYGAIQQLTSAPDDSEPIDADETKRLQRVLGTLLFYARAVDGSMLVALGTLGAAQTKGTRQTIKALKHLLNYAASHPDATVRYQASDMILTLHSDASYLSEAEARSRAGGYFYFDNQPESKPLPQVNDNILINSIIMRQVLASATEAEVGAVFYNCQEAVPLRVTSEFLGHPQPATPVVTDNAACEGIINDKVKQRRSKAIDMRFYWVRDRVRQGQFNLYWEPGRSNHGDYWTKHHCHQHHRDVRPTYFFQRKQSTARVPPASLGA